MSSWPLSLAYLHHIEGKRREHAAAAQIAGEFVAFLEARRRAQHRAADDAVGQGAAGRLEGLGQGDAVPEQGAERAAEALDVDLGEEIAEQRQAQQRAVPAPLECGVFQCAAQPDDGKDEAEHDRPGPGGDEIADIHHRLGNRGSDFPASANSGAKEGSTKTRITTMDSPVVASSMHG
ncbi:MAG: hypothetical protein WDN03_09590 [Rhizomicrobium sp.]